MLLFHKLRHFNFSISMLILGNVTVEVESIWSIWSEGRLVSEGGAE